MIGYSAVFLKIDGLDIQALEPHHPLSATNRIQAESEVGSLPKPEGANFIRLYLDGLYQPPQIGIAL